MMRLKYEPPFFTWFFPEVEQFDNEEHRRSAILVAMILRGSYTIAAVVLTCATIPIALVWSEYVLGKLGFIIHMAIAIFVALAIMTLANIVFFLRYSQPIRYTLRLKLNESGIPVCMECGYQLQGITELRCPECGRPFEPRRRDEDSPAVME